MPSSDQKEVKEILIIEDDEQMARSLRRLLEREGFVIHVATCGEAALSYAAEHRSSLVMLDLRLPDVGGYEVCKSLRKLYHPWAVPILMLTGMDRPIDQLRGFAHGADAYLIKPCESSELLSTISLLLGQSLVT